MAISLSGSGQYLAQGTAIVSTLPLTLSCWFKPTSTATTGTLLSISNNSTENSYFILVMIGGGTLRAQQSTAGAAAAAITTTSMTANTWYHCAAVFTSATSRTVYLNGVAASSITSNAGGVVNVTAIGTNFQGSAAALNACNGTIAYEAIWNTSLSSSDIANLYNSGLGSDPRLIQGGSISSFSLLSSSPFADQGASTVWTTTGSPVIAADPFSVSGGGITGGDGRFGFATHFNQGWPTSLMPLISATGVGYIRDNLTTNGANGWETAPGVFQVSPTDAVWCNAAHANGLKVVGIMGGNNQYTTGTFYDPTQMGARAAFIAQSGLVDVIEVLSEPNNAYQTYEVSISRNWLTDLPILTTAVTNAVNAVSSTVQVIGLGAQGSEIWTMSPSTTVDGVSYHPYDTGNSKAANDVPDTCFEQPSGVNATSSLLYVPWINICRGQTPLPLWETEWGVQQPSVSTDTGTFTQDNQSCYLVRRVLTAAGLGVEHTFIYEFKDNNSTDQFGVYLIDSVTPKASYAAVTNTISALQGVVGTPTVNPTIVSIAVPPGAPYVANAYAYSGPGKTVISSWFGGATPSSPPTPTTMVIKFTVPGPSNGIVMNPIAGTSVPLSTYSTSLSGNQLTVSGLPISDHPLLIVLNTDTTVTASSSSNSLVNPRTHVLSVTSRFIQRAVNHVTSSGSITCPVTTATTGTGNLLVVYIGTRIAGAVITSVTDNKGNVYTPAFTTTAFNASLFCYNCTNSIAGTTIMTVVSAASPAAGNLDVVFYEFSAGTGSTWSFDEDAIAGTNVGTTAANSGSTGSTQMQNEILIAACAAFGTTVSGGTTSPAGWTGSVTGLNGWSEYMNVAAISTYPSSFTLAASGFSWSAAIGTWFALAPDIRTSTNAFSNSATSANATQMSSVSELFVQTANNRVTNSGTITCPVTISPTATGNLLVVYIGALASGAIITSVTDNKGNVYTLAFSDTVPTTSLFCYQCLSCIAGATTITVLSSASINANTLDVSVYEMSGTGAWHFDKFSVAGANNSGTTSVSAGTTPATTFANEVVISACFANGTSVTAGSGSPWTGGAT